MKNQITKEEFALRRRSGIGGSDMARLIGLSPWGGRFNVWQDKIETGPAVDNPTVRMRIGTELEDLAARMYEEETGRKVCRLDVQLKAKDPDDCRIGNVDRLCFCEDGRKPWTPKRGVRTDRALEIKTSSDLSEWEVVPDYYMAQIQHYMGLMPTVRVFDVPVLFLAKGTFRIYTVERDERAIEVMKEVANDFWKRYVLTKTPPPPSTEEEAKARYPSHSEGKVAVASEKIEEAVRRIYACQQAVKVAEAEMDGLKALVQTAMQDAETLVMPDMKTKLCSWKGGVERTSIDWHAAFESIRGMLDESIVRNAIEKASKTGLTSRVFRISPSFVKN